jgi:hypothetical protein
MKLNGDKELKANSIEREKGRLLLAPPGGDLKVGINLPNGARRSDISF